MAFLESPRFPTNISFASAGGPRYEVSIVQVESGFESRNLEQDESLHRYDVEYGIKNEDDLYSLLEFFHAMQGPTHTFRYKDWADFKSSSNRNRDAILTSTDQDLLPTVGDGVEKVFQLVKRYVKGGFQSVRTIKKPVIGTDLIEVNGALQTGGGTNYTLDPVTGLVTFVVAPPVSHTVKGGFEFDVPVRFETERLETSWVAHAAGGQSVIVQEVRIA